MNGRYGSALDRHTPWPTLPCSCSTTARNGCGARRGDARHPYGFHAGAPASSAASSRRGVPLPLRELGPDGLASASSSTSPRRDDRTERHRRQQRGRHRSRAQAGRGGSLWGPEGRGHRPAGWRFPFRNFEVDHMIPAREGRLRPRRLRPGVDHLPGLLTLPLLRCAW